MVQVFEHENIDAPPFNNEEWLKVKQKAEIQCAELGATVHCISAVRNRIINHHALRFNLTLPEDTQIITPKHAGFIDFYYDMSALWGHALTQHTRYNWVYLNCAGCGKRVKLSRAQWEAPRYYCSLCYKFVKRNKNVNV